MGDGHGFGETKNEGTRQLGTGSLVLAASEDDVVIVEADVEVFDTAAGARRAVRAQEFESHGGFGRQASDQMAIGWNWGGRSGGTKAQLRA